MTYIDDISDRPWSMIDFRKYQQYLEMRKQRDKFLKSLWEMSYLDWLIDKRLIEAGGLGKTIYILPARGGGTTFRTLARINDFLEEGRDVQAVTINKYEWSTLSDKDIETIRESVQEFQLYSQLVKTYQDPVSYLLFKDFDPHGGWTLDPCWTVDPYGHVRFREVSLVQRRDDHENYDQN